MSATTTIPIVVTPEAAARIAELGMQAAVEQMIEHTRQTVPDLKALDVVLESAWDTGDEPYLTIHAYLDRDWDPSETITQEWNRWQIRTFPPGVFRHIAMLLNYRSNHEG